MMETNALQRMAHGCEQELLEHILPFWRGLKDSRGGFYGRMTRDLVVYGDAPKGVILHARILWSFSSAYLACANPGDLWAAEHAYKFLQMAEDPAHGGVYWSMTAEGKPHETEKYSYCNAFAIYGLCAYAEAAKSQEALEFAMRLFRVIEQHAAGKHGYIETFTADWKPLENDHLSEHDLHAAKTMNTTLHLIEAYAELYRLTKDKAVEMALRELLRLMKEEIYRPEKEMLHVFFDENMQPIGDIHSYGHDIESSWLVDHACDCLGDAEIQKEWRAINYKLAEHVYRVAFADGALYNERFADIVDRTRIWWVQAEGVIGFLNAAQTALEVQDSAAAERYLDAAATIWSYIRDYQIDRRQGGEWFAETDPNGNPQSEFDMAGPWKCPYHNSRMCLEVIHRVARHF